MTITINKLKGQELLDYIDANKDTPRSEVVKGAGYVRFDEEGKLFLSMTEFYQEMLDAKQVALGDVTESNDDQKPGFMTVLVSVPVMTWKTKCVEVPVESTREEVIKLAEEDVFAWDYDHEGDVQPYEKWGVENIDSGEEITN